MGTNPSPLTTLQLTSPLPSPSATPGRPVIGGDDQVSTASSGNSNNDHNLTNAAILSTIEGGGGGRGRGGIGGDAWREEYAVAVKAVGGDECGVFEGGVNLEATSTAWSGVTV